jgi:NTE family protein
VLGGGGGFGIVQAAYIQAAHELGFRPSIVVGTSVGALNGAWLAMHPDQPEGLLPVWRGLHKRRVLGTNPLRLAGRVLRRNGGVFSNDLVPRLLKDHIGQARFEQTALRLAVVATNLSEGRKKVFNTGRLAPAIMASTAIPGLFDPVKLNGELFVDGSITASVDLATAMDMGASEILAIDLTADSPIATPRTPIGVLLRSMYIMAHATTDGMQALAERQMPVRVLRPDLSRHSPWRIASDEDEMALSLAEARAVLRSVLDDAGRVIPAAAAPTGAASEDLAPTLPLSRPVRLSPAQGFGQAG